MAKSKPKKLQFDIPEPRPAPEPEVCPYCHEFSDPIRTGTVSNQGVWRCDLCGYRWVMGWWYWQWIDRWKQQNEES